MKAQVSGAEGIFNCIVLSSFRRKLLSEAKKNYRNHANRTVNLSHQRFIAAFFVEIEANGYNEVWGCDYVLVTYKGRTEEFPVFDWITDTIDVAAGKGK